MSLKDSELRNVCARVYNDAIIDLQAAGNGRLFPQALTPFWDIDDACARCGAVKDAGITGITMTDTPEAFELPHLHDAHWDPLWSTCQEMGIPVNFHIGSGNNLGGQMLWKGYGPQRSLAALSVSLFMVQCKTIMNLIFSGLLDRYPNLNFVSVESGIGWIPFLLEAMEWQYDETIPTEREGLSLRPKEYFKRQGTPRSGSSSGDRCTRSKSWVRTTLCSRRTSRTRPAFTRRRTRVSRRRWTSSPDGAAQGAARHGGAGLPPAGDRVETASGV